MNHCKRRDFLKQASLGTAALLFAGRVSTARAAEQASKPPIPVPLGKLDAFWRYSAALGPFLEDGQGLVEIPDYLLRGDFPYQKKPFAKEVPFADHLSIVRPLGGYKEDDDAAHTRDLAYRGPDGKIRYRLELLRPRLRPYLDCGYTNFTLVLDNVPWCFPAKPEAGSEFGQSAPPRDPQEWHDFVKALCRELENIMGPKAARRLRFRVGTENNGRKRFDGTQAEYFRHYDAAAKAVGEALPGAQFGPFNISGISFASIERHNVNAYALAEHCAAQKLPFDWVAFSRYFRPGEDPEWHAQTCREVWDEFGKRVPQFKGLSREIHEFGIAPFGEAAKGVFVSEEPGALGAALTSQIMWRLREAGINRLWHWGVTDRSRNRKNGLEELFTSKAWLLNVMEQMAGGEAWLFPPLEKSASHTHYLAAGSFKTNRALLMISAYHTDCAIHANETVSFHVPIKLLNPTHMTARCVRLTPQTSVHDRIRRELAAAGLLQAGFTSRPNRLGSVRQMGAGRPAETFVGDHMKDYEQQWVDSLTLQPLTPEIGEIKHDQSGVTISVHLTAPEVLVLDLKGPSPGIP